MKCKQSKRKQPVNRMGEVQVCAHCNTSYRKVYKTKYCSVKCRSIAGAAFYKCNHCGDQYRSRSSSVYCSADCRVKARTFNCGECGVKHHQTHGKLCGLCSTCAQAKRWRRANMRRQGRSPEKSAMQLWERDGGTCGICKKKIDLRFEYPHRLAVTIDHIKPQSKGGSDSAENLQPAHLSCNSRKQAEDGAQLRLFG